jgi:hypothetical protein
VSVIAGCRVRGMRRQSEGDPGSAPVARRALAAFMGRLPVLIVRITGPFACECCGGRAVR